MSTENVSTQDVLGALDALDAAIASLTWIALSANLSSAQEEAEWCLGRVNRLMAGRPRVFDSRVDGGRALAHYDRLRVEAEQVDGDARYERALGESRN